MCTLPETNQLELNDGLDPWPWTRNVMLWDWFGVKSCGMKGVIDIQYVGWSYAPNEVKGRQFDGVIPPV